MAGQGYIGIRWLNREDSEDSDRSFPEPLPLFVSFYFFVFSSFCFKDM